MKSWMAILVFSILNNARPSVSVRGVRCVCVSISEQLTDG